MRYIRYVFLGCLGIILISVSMANRGMVTLNLLPEELAGLVKATIGVTIPLFSITLPLFVVVLGSIIAGLIIGFIWEWLREFRLRRAAGRNSRQVGELQREVGRLKDEKHQGKDEVLAILEEVG